MIDSYILTWDQNGVKTYCSEWVGLRFLHADSEDSDQTGRDVEGAGVWGAGFCPLCIFMLR